MTRAEFSSVISYLALAIGKDLDPQRLEVFFDLLGDLPYEAFKTAAARVALEHPWATFPSVAELRAAAVLTMQGTVKELSPAEAWEIAWDAIKRIDLEVEGSLERATEGMPPIVLEAMNAFGLPSLIHGDDPVSVVRGQFMKIFEQFASRAKREALMPPRVKQELATMRGEYPPNHPVGAIAGKIGAIPE